MATPMLEQYYALKQQYPDCILLFRLGDFFEGFAEDAKLLSKVLGITLTGRGKDENRIDMAGIPHHALKQYLPKLVKAGLKVAITEQLEEAAPGKLVKRDVVKIITAGTLLDENTLEVTENNYLVALYHKNERGKAIWGFSFADLSTGEFKLAEFFSTKSNKELPRDLITEIFRLRPAEVLLPRKIADEFKFIFPNQTLQILEELDFNYNDAVRNLEKCLGVNSLKGFGVAEAIAGLTAAGALYNYLLQTQKTDLSHLTKISKHHYQEYMSLDQATIRNLELIYPLQIDHSGKTLFDILNKCATPMGQRLLRSWILRPLLDKSKIDQRLQTVGILFENSDLAGKLNHSLQEVPDLERILARIATRGTNARDLLFLKKGLENVLQAMVVIESSKLDGLQNFLPKSASLEKIKSEVVDLIAKGIKEDPEVTITEGNIIKPGYSSELDLIKKDELTGKDFIRSLQAQEIERSGIPSLKVRFNKVFGYYIEISQSNLHKVPTNYIRKQTLVNAERFITEELKTWEEKVLGAEEKAAKLEYKLFEEIRGKIIMQIAAMQEVIAKVSELDVLLNFTNLAKAYKYTRPEIIDSASEEMTRIVGGRHPVVERFSLAQFIANDLDFNSENQQVIILTGPNMSGKSTYIRQNALIFLMAQIGSFVPATSAKIAVVDRIFTRVGASDNLASGESTFMVEMNETANILNNATERSLLILDEVGRGTSTYDGVAIAWAVVEYIATHIKARTLFATHYHELIQLEDKYPHIKNFNVEVKEDEGKILFRHKIIPGGTDESYGIHVAQIAGVPKSVIKRANEILVNLEAEQLMARKDEKISADQLGFVVVENDDALRKELQDLDVNLITPLDALLKLKELKEKL